jgi:hypothetical protein
MGLVVRDDGWRMPDWLWERIAPVLPSPPSHPYDPLLAGIRGRDAYGSDGARTRVGRPSRSGSESADL